MKGLCIFGNFIDQGKVTAITFRTVGNQNSLKFCVNKRNMMKL